MKILVKKYVPELVLRQNVRALFDFIENQEDKEICLDFSDLNSISRSFAHEYMKRLSKTKKHVVEENVSENIKRMFKIVEENKTRKFRFDFSKTKVIVV